MTTFQGTTSLYSTFLVCINSWDENVRRVVDQKHFPQIVKIQERYSSQCGYDKKKKHKNLYDWIIRVTGVQISIKIMSCLKAILSGRIQKGKRGFHFCFVYVIYQYFCRCYISLAIISDNIILRSSRSNTHVL